MIIIKHGKNQSLNDGNSGVNFVGVNGWLMKPKLSAGLLGMLTE